VLLVVAVSSSTAAQESSRSTAIVLTKGADTIVVERIQRAGSSVTAAIAARGASSLTVTSTLSPQHLVASATFRAWGPGAPVDQPPLQTGTLEFRRDSVIVQIWGGGNWMTQRFGTRPEALLLVNNDFVVDGQVARRARAQGLTRLTQPVFTLTGGQTRDATFERFAVDSAQFSIAGNVSVVSLDGADNVTGGHLPGQGVRVAIVTGPAAAAISLGKPDYSAPAGAPYTAEEIVVRTPAGHQLAGTLTRPTGATGRVPAVVTITGSGAQDRDESIPVGTGFRVFRRVADTLGRRGIAVLRLDDRGVGGSGGAANATSADFANDIRAALPTCARVRRSMRVASRWPATAREG
jgi:hypothetical protein